MAYTLLGLVAYLALTALPHVVALRQVIHDGEFQPDYALHITRQEVSIACTSRFTTLVNRSLPGPLIHMRENQTTWVRVYNDMDSDNLTMHWHGLSQSVAPYSDGSPQVTQWPIKARHFYDYEIQPQIGEAGTYFYHSHIGFQAVSAAGPLVIEEANGVSPPYVYDEERILFLSELFNKTDRMIEEELIRPYDVVAWTGEAETILVNGNSYLGIDADESKTPEPWSEPCPSIQTTCGPEVIEVEPGKTYRMRAIGGTALNVVSIVFEDHHNLSVIAVDAQYTKPAGTDRVQVGSGQRFDFLFHAKTETELQRLGKSIFWIQLETRYRPINVTSYAVLSYNTNLSFNQSIPSSAPETAPLTITDNIQDWLEYSLQPLSANDFPNSGAVNRQVILRSAQVAATSGLFETVNNRTWTESDQHLGNTTFDDRSLTNGIPYLVDVYQRGEAAIPDYEIAVQQYGGWDPALNVYAARVGEVIDIILLNEPNGLPVGFDVHPWHIHGGHVYDLGSGPGTYNATANEERLRGTSPVKRDSTLLYKYTTGGYVGENKNYTVQGWRAWRLKVENAGVWMIHCHALHHMIMGMQTVWVVGNSSQITRGTTPDLVTGYLSYGGNAYGNASYDPLVNHYFEE